MSNLKVFAQPFASDGIIISYKNDFIFDYGRKQTRNQPGNNVISIELVSNLRSADICTLPYTWNYYVDNKRINQAKQFINAAQKANKQVVIFSSGDFTATIPFSNIILMETSGYRSRRGIKGNQIWGVPTFIGDYLSMYNNGMALIRNKEKLPIVGFCGQSGGNRLHFCARYLINRWRWLNYHIGIRRWEPTPFETTFFRKKILDCLENSPKVVTNFIRRIKYRAGYWAKKKDPLHPSRIEFINNIINTDYTVCMRGGGNFSVRFYETLSLGRIPIFIDTDCILPLDDHIDYRQYCVWVDKSEIPYLAEKVADFHASLTPQDFIDLQHDCRKLWENNFTKENYYTQLCNQLLCLTSQ